MFEICGKRQTIYQPSRLRDSLVKLMTVRTLDYVSYLLKSDNLVVYLTIQPTDMER